MGKRLMDILGAIIGLLLLSPVFLLMSFLVYLSVGWPILFVQKRPGRHGKAFAILKFRTMKDERDGMGRLLPDSVRLTRAGGFLRSTSLDELPELFNVLKGDMSLVGPRPLLMEYLPLYTDRQARRHKVRPGITGWAQITGRNALSWEKRFELDVWYVENRSLWLDLKIIFLTLKKVLAREGINQEGQATMERFRGSQA